MFEFFSAYFHLKWKISIIVTGRFQHKVEDLYFEILQLSRRFDKK